MIRHITKMLLFLLLCALQAKAEVMPSYHEFLSQSPINHSDGVTQFHVFGDYSLWQEEGRVFLSELDRERMSAGAGLTLENGLLIEFELIRWTDYFEIPGEYEAEGSGLRFHLPVGNSAALNVRSEKKNYEQPEADDDSMIDIGLVWHVADAASLSLDFRSGEEVYNYYALLQAIEADIISASLSYGDVTKCELTAEFIDYSDNNEATRLYGSISHNISLDSADISPFVELAYRDVQHPTFFLIVPGGGILGVTHPYWAPDDYFSGSIGIDCQMDLPRGVELSACAKAVYDSDEELGLNAQILLAHSSLYLKGQIYRSDVWDSEGLSVGARFLF